VNVSGPEPEYESPVPVPLDGVLDLHGFQPREVGGLVREYIAACQAAGTLDLRLIHGRGIGNLQRTVHAVLAKHPSVLSFQLASPLYGGLGATIVRLRPLDARAASGEPGV